MALSRAKGLLRRQIRRQIGGLSPVDWALASARIVDRLTVMFPDGDVLAYAALSDEIDVSAWLTPLSAQGRLVLPRVGEDGLTLHRVHDLERDLAPGTHGILEPVGQPDVALDSVAVAVVPGRAFDAQGGRLGRGGGHYDRLLPSLQHATRVGVCHPVQLVDHVPGEAHDVRMHLVLTDRQVVRCE